MKKLLQFLMTMFLSVAMVGCYSTEEPVGPDVPVVGSLKLSQEEMTVGAEGGEFSVDIFTEYAYETSTNVDWVTISGGSCGTEYCTLYFTVAKNDTTSEREGVITVFCDDFNLTATLTVSQEAGKNSGDTIPNNEIWYTSTDGAIVEPYKTDVFGANIVSNTYENGKGVITFDGDVTQIGKDAFYAFSSTAAGRRLTSITLPNSVTSIGNHAFLCCTSLKAFYGKFASADNRCLIVDGVLHSFAIGCGATEYTISDSVTSIGSSAFWDCTSLTSVAIPDSVTEIGMYAFHGCTSLTEVTIPDSVTTIGVTAFRECTSLKAFYGKFASADNRCLIVNSVLNSFAPAGLTEYAIPDSVTEIGGEAFASYTSITAITIPDSVTSIGFRAFHNCTSLTAIAIPDSVTLIGEQAFNGCTSLTEVTIPDSVTSIRNGTFFMCASLRSITIPDSVTSIGDSAFYKCTSLKEVYCKPTIPPIGYSLMFYNNASGRKIYVPRESVSAYKAASYWSVYASDIVGYDF